MASETLNRQLSGYQKWTIWMVLLTLATVGAGILLWSFYQGSEVTPPRTYPIYVSPKNVEATNPILQKVGDISVSIEGFQLLEPSFERVYLYSAKEGKLYYYGYLPNRQEMHIAIQRIESGSSRFGTIDRNFQLNLREETVVVSDTKTSGSMPNIISSFVLAVVWAMSLGSRPHRQ